MQPSSHDALPPPDAPLSRSRQRLAPGTVLDGVYRVEALVGSGAGGSVYRVVHEGLGRRFALKILDDVEDAEGAYRLALEARTASAIDHDHIVSVTHLGRDGAGRPFVVMEWLEGEDLRARLERAPTGLPLDEAEAIVGQVLSALGAAHAAGVVHRDVKPANLVLTQRHGRVHATLVDFGMSRQVHGDVGVTRTGQLVGTPLYMAPEQSRGATVDARADVYSAGVLAYEVLSGRPPFAATSLYECVLAHAIEPVPALRGQRPEVPEAVAAAVHRMLEKAPDDRPAGGTDAAEAWAAAWRFGTTALEAPGPDARGYDAPPTVESGVRRVPGSRASRLRRAEWVVGLGALALLVVAGLGLATRGSTPHGPQPPGAPTPGLQEVAEPVVARDVPLAHPAGASTAPTRSPTDAPLELVSSPPGATVLDETGASLGSTPLHLARAAVRGPLRFVLAGYQPEVRTPGDAPRLEVTLRRIAARRPAREDAPLPALAPR